MKSNSAILVINCGSSGVKFALLADEADAPRRLWSGALQRLGLPEGRFRAKAEDGAILFDEIVDIPNHVAALDLLVSRVADFTSRNTLGAVGHRIVHGGDECDRPLLVTPALEARLRRLVQLAPLHLPHNLAGIAAVKVARPELPQVACFDTAFHRAARRRPPRMKRPSISFRNASPVARSTKEEFEQRKRLLSD